MFYFRAYDQILKVLNAYFLYLRNIVIMLILGKCLIVLFRMLRINYI